MQLQQSQAVTVDIRSTKRINANLVFVQGDTNIIDITILDSGSPADLSAVGKIIANYQLPNNTVVSRSLTIPASGNLITYTLGQEEQAIGGIGEVEIQFYDSTSSYRISTLQFKVNLLAEIGQDSTISSNPTYTLLEELLQSVQTNASQSSDKATWIASAGQLTYTLPSGKTYDPNGNWLDVWVGGSYIDPTLVQKNSSTQFTFNVNSALIPAGVEVIARWANPNIPATSQSPSGNPVVENEWEWTATAGQLTYVLPTGQTYDNTTKWLEVSVGGAIIPDSQVSKDSGTQFTLIMDSSKIQAGMTVTARCPQTYVFANTAHHTTHELGGYDAIDVTNMKNYQSAIATPITNINTNMGSLSNLTTSDKSSLVNAINSNTAGLASNTQKTQHIIHIEEYINLVPAYNTTSDTTQWDWTAAWNQAISDLQSQTSTKGFRTLFLAGRNYNINQSTTVTFPLSLQGIYNGRKYTSDTGGTKIVDKSTGSTAFITYNGPGVSGGRMWGGIHIQDIHIDGQNAAHDCIYMQNTAWEMMINHLYIENFQGSALFCDTVYDSNIYGLTIVNCGGLSVGGVTRYALVLDSSVSDCTNAMHFFGLHIEKCRYMIKFKAARHNQFIGCKFEAYETYTISSDLTNPYIWVDAVSLENQFVGTMFVPPRAEDWITLGYATTITQVPYFFSGMGTGTVDPNTQAIILEGCVVTNPPGQAQVGGTYTGVAGGGSRFITSGSPNAVFKLNNCHIDHLHGGDYGIYVKNGSQISNSKISVQVDGNGHCYGLRVDNASAVNNTITEVYRSGVTMTADTAILGANASILDNNKFNGFTTMVMGDSGSTNLAYRRKKNFLHVTESVYMTAMGLGSINYSNVMIDLSKFDCSHLSLEFNSNFTVNGIINGFDGDEIYLHNNKGGVTMTIANNVNNATNSLILTKSGANTNISANQLALLKFTGWQWMQVA